MFKIIGDGKGDSFVRSFGDGHEVFCYWFDKESGEEFVAVFFNDDFFIHILWVVDAISSISIMDVEKYSFFNSFENEI